MDFIKALKEAEAAGVSGEQFLKIWDYETKIKQMESGHLETKVSGDVTSAVSLFEAQLQKFSLDQRRVLTNLREELQQQNQALIADISRLLEGFATLVGRVVKGELQTALEGLNLSASGNSSSNGAQTSSQAGQTTGSSGAGSTRTWSKVHVEQSSSSGGDDYHGDQITVEDLIHKADQNLVKKKKTKSRGGRGKKKQSSSQGDKVKLKPKNEQVNKIPEAPEVPTFSALIKDLKHGHDMDPSIHFFPEDGPANMVVFDIFEVAKSGKISKSPVYYLQDCPFKVQLSLWFDTDTEIKMSVTFWGLSPSPIALARVFTICGESKNKNSSSYSPLFMECSPPLQLHKANFQKMDLHLVLKTQKGSFKEMNLEMLNMRNYIFEDRHSISLRWKLTSEEI